MYMLQGVMRLITSCGMRVFLVETRENSLFGVKKVGNENKNENERMEQDKDLFQVFTRNDKRYRRKENMFVSFIL